MQRGALVLGIALIAVGCRAGPPTTPVQESSLRYVALGDSYTIGTSVAEDERWPNQLRGRVGGMEIAANLAVNGYTSSDVLEGELPEVEPLRPDLVTLLIGVNDVVQGVPADQYAENVERILDELLTLLPADRVLCVATPDYTVTPRGAAFGDPEQQRAGIVRVNDILRDACRSRGIGFVGEIFEISQRAADDGSLVADDALHPSGLQYERWVDSIAPIVRDLLAS